MELPAIVATDLGTLWIPYFNSQMV